MQLLKYVQGGVTGALNYVVDKNRNFSLISKVKHIIREEERHANEAYIALGKYYYHHLRDAENNETEFYCAEVDRAERRLQRAEMKLEELTQCHSEVYSFDDESFEAFCRECDEQNGSDASWGYDAAGNPVNGEADEVDEGVDVDLPPQVREAIRARKAEEKAEAENASEEDTPEDPA